MKVLVAIESCRQDLCIDASMMRLFLVRIGIGSELDTPWRSAHDTRGFYSALFPLLQMAINVTLYCTKSRQLV